MSIQAAGAYAFYSPELNSQANIVKQHLTDSKKLNGDGTLQQAYDKIGSKANTGLYNTFVDSVKSIITEHLTDSFLDSLSLLFGRWIGTNAWISNCLRDDIWQLQALQEQILAEIFRDAILDDTANSNILWKDYTGLNDTYKNLHDNYRKGDIWFPKNKNLYVECPYGEFTKAWIDVKRAFDSLKALGQGSLELGSFGSIAKKADERAIVKARDYIRKNQITLSVGDGGGSSSSSLLRDHGFTQLTARIKTEFAYAESLAELIFSNTYKGITGFKPDANVLNDINTYAAAYQAAYEAKHLAQNQLANAIKFNLSLNDIGESELNSINSVLKDTDTVIRSAVEIKISSNNLSTFCEKLLKLVKVQCGGRNAAGLSCK